MRRSRDSDNQVICNEAGEPYGLFLAADHCAQHEWGIKGLEQLFGVDRSLPGIPGRTSTLVPADYIEMGSRTSKIETPESKAGRRRYKQIKCFFLTAHAWSAREVLSSELKRYPGQHDIELIAGFDEKSFAVAGYSDLASDAIWTIRDAIAQKDLCIMMGGGNANPFDKGGLVLARASMIPEELKKTTLEADLETRRLEAAADETGIRQKIEANPLPSYGRFALKRYHALMPAWVEPFESLIGREGRPADQTRHPVIFFLNPADQKNNNSGWFTVEELEQWLEGKGPVIKEKAAA